MCLDVPSVYIFSSNILKVKWGILLIFSLSVFVCVSVSWHGKMHFFFEGKKNTQVTYREKMLKMKHFSQIMAMMDGKRWVGQQDDAALHTALKTQEFLSEACPDFIRKADWPSKTRDLSIMDYALWGILSQKLSKNHSEMKTIEDLQAGYFLSTFFIHLQNFLCGGNIFYDLAIHFL